MPEYFPPPEEVIGSPVLCTALLTLPMFSSWKNAPAPLRSPKASSSITDEVNLFSNM